MNETAPDSKTISGTEGFLLTPRLPESAHRLTLYISSEDMRSVMAYGRGAGYKGGVKDLETQVCYEIYGAECEIPKCYCDAVAVRVEPDTPPVE